MKTPRNLGPTLMLATALSLVVAATPRASGQLPSAGIGAASMTERDGEVVVAAARKVCKFGQRFSSYYRRCVLWTPIDWS